MPQVESPDGEVTIRQQDLPTAPLFAGVSIPDVLTQAMAYQSADTSTPPPASAAVLSTPKPGEMTVLAQRLGRVHLETPMRPSKLNFSEQSDKENVVNSSGSKPPRMTPEIKSSPLADRTPPVTPVPSLGIVGVSASVRPAGVSTTPKTSSLDSHLETIREVDVDSAESPRNRALAGAFRGLQALLHDAYTPALGDRVRAEMLDITSSLEKCTSRGHPELNDRALHLVNILVETGCSKGTELVTRLFDNVASMACSINLASATLALFLREEPANAILLRKVKNVAAIVRNLEKQATALRTKGSTRRVRVVDQAIELVKSATNVAYVPGSYAGQGSPRTPGSSTYSPGALSSQTSFVSNLSTPQALPMPAKLESQLSVLGTPPPGSPAAFSPSPTSTKAGIPFNKRLSTARKVPPLTPGDRRTYTQAECDAAVRAAVAETEKRHQEISKAEYGTLLRNAVAEAEMNQKKTMQAEFDIALRNALREEEERVRQQVKVEHESNVEKCVKEAEEKTRAECETEYEEKIGVEVGKQKDEGKTMADRAVREAIQKAEDKANLKIEQLESELESVTREAERSMKEYAQKLEKAQQEVDEERMARESIAKNVELGFQSRIEELNKEREDIMETMNQIKAEYVTMQENEAIAVEQNNELREACRGLEKWANSVKENSQKKLDKAFTNVQQFRDQFLERDAACKSMEYLANSTKEKLEIEEQKVVDLSASLATAEMRISRLEADARTNKSAVSKMIALEKECSVLKQKLHDVTDRLEAASKEAYDLKPVKTELETAKVKLEQSEVEVQRLSKQSFDLHSQLVSKTNELEKCYEVAEETMAMLEENEKKHRSKVSICQKERDDLRVKNGSMLMELRKCSKERDELRLKNGSIVEELRVVSKERDELLLNNN